jgi:hypothetical protein
MEDTIGKDWKNLFDLVLSNCHKPDFFSGARTPFLSEEYKSSKTKAKEKEQTGVALIGKEFSGGSVSLLYELL